MEFVPLLVLVAINKKVVDFLKELLPDNLQNKLVQLIAWAVGVLTIFLFAESDYADEIEFGEKALSDLNIFSLVIVGIAIGSSAGVVNDIIDRRNPDENSDDSKYTYP